MLTEITLENFKCFSQQTVPLRPLTIIVGRNNAGKSTIIEALRLISIVTSRIGGLAVREVPSWLDRPIVNRGVAPSLENQEFNFASAFHRYNNPPAKITGRFQTGVKIEIFIGGENKVHAVFKNSHNVVISGGQAKRLGIPSVGILPQISPVSDDETILVPTYVRKKVSSSLASLHFRNQLNLLYDEAFREFKRISEETWPGLVVRELRGQGGKPGEPLKLLVRNDDFVAEISWMGHGLQMWLQTMWFLARCQRFETVILDEPDVYMHADLQRRLIRFLRGRHQQVIIATHSVEIMSEVDPENILLVDRDRRQAQFAVDVPEMQRVVDQIGGVHNIQLARLWGSRRCLFVEGKDVAILKHFQNRLFPKSIDPIDAIPNLSVGGWGGWNYVVGSAMLLRKSVGDIKVYCIFDSDFHTPGQIEARELEAREKGLDLHVWRRKEIENYLLIPEAILRATGSKGIGSAEPLTTELIANKLFAFTGESEEDMMDALATEYQQENRPGGSSQANKAARAHMRSRWRTSEGRFSMAPGKIVLARLSQWLQEKYGISISPPRIIREMHLREIEPEILDVLRAIENSAPF